MARDTEERQDRDPMATDTSISENPFTDDAAPIDGSALARAIQEHLDLKQRNASLDGNMPLDKYSMDDPFENHPLFKSEEQARLEETLHDGETNNTPVLPWPGEDSEPEGAALDDSLWGRSRDFDWGE